MNCTELDLAITEVHATLIENDWGFALGTGSLAAVSLLLLVAGGELMRVPKKRMSKSEAEVHVDCLTVTLSEQEDACDVLFRLAVEYHVLAEAYKKQYKCSLQHQDLLLTHECALLESRWRLRCFYGFLLGVAVGAVWK